MANAYIIQTYREGVRADDDRDTEVASLHLARTEARRRLRVSRLTKKMLGACPDEEPDSLIGIECWMPYQDEDYIPEGTVFIYRRECPTP
jgi:hypothetical protein